ncbi:sigma-70 family RNA polymerase sigma factor [Maribacter algicola]|uniref:Sigma-70 family RNA polymerase sigma factor n=1 Tax=Maribacter algicola TaxID=2498892 RepID=A0A426RNQ5_9FLAO|nr:sigma-70 family RNA polymerase sigma factor [Maribacter algicola]RRQ50602.1 sigma-70 family RNA polymerase sigma factor [Maribacter algicola]
MPKKLFNNVCEEQIFSLIYKRFSKELYDTLYYRYGNQINTKDKVQDAFVKLWENCKNIEFENAKGFLFVTAKNLGLNEIKHNKVVLNFANTAPTQQEEEPEFIKEADPKLLRYKEALEKLTESQRVAFMLSKIEGKKHSDIAEILGISQKTVEKRIYAALKKIKEAIKK